MFLALLRAFLDGCIIAMLYALYRYIKYKLK